MAEIYSVAPDMEAIVSDKDNYLELRDDKQWALHTQDKNGDEVIVTSEQFDQEYESIIADFDKSALKGCAVDDPVNKDPAITDDTIKDNLEALREITERDKEAIDKDLGALKSLADIGYETVLKDSDLRLENMSNTVLNVLDRVAQRADIECGRQ